MAAQHVTAAINLRLSLLGLPIAGDHEGSETSRLVAPIIARQRELSRRLADRLPAVDSRIERFLNAYLDDSAGTPRLPRQTLVLDEAGLARALSLPVEGDSFTSPLVSSYRLHNGVLHNPASDRRTTAGVFHIAEGGSPVPDDKVAVPRDVFAALLERAFRPPAEALVLPFAANQPEPAACFVSLLLRPLVVPAVPGVSSERRMETRFFAPGGLVSNLDFVEQIFGNAGDPYLPENDASLDAAGWTGTTGCVILAPHLTAATKKELGLPRWEAATERQRRDGQCWRAEDERYNGGQAFKICARDARGVMVTVIADNYFGYCKKEVKTQISYSANLFGSVEEEHAGGALVFPSHNMGMEFTDRYSADRSIDDVVARDPQRFASQPEGHAVDLQQDHLVLVPASSTFSLHTQTVSWDGADGSRRSIRLRADKEYVTPAGDRVRMQQVAADRTQWNLISTEARATAIHKPSTVSGGGKSEISKAITDAYIFANAYTANFEEDIEAVGLILEGDYSGRFADPRAAGKDQRSILSEERSMGSVIKLLTPSSAFTDEYNARLAGIPQHIKEMVFAVKRHYRPEWGADWRSHFTVGIINGRHGNALRLDGAKIVVNALRVGFDPDGSWRIFGLRHDFSPAVKVQLEDDITASIVAPPRPEGSGSRSRKYVANCERLLFQRPDDAIHRGYDKQAEADIAGPDTFLSNFEPLDRAAARAMVDDAIGFNAFTAPMQELIRRAAAAPEGSSPAYVVSSANPRLVDGKPSKNPRYLQLRPDLANPGATAAADLALRLRHRVPAARPIAVPIDVVAAGRRNNPPEPGVRPLCTFNPLHWMELPELFMEFISSMTGKSPSTTGAGSEGALTKGPFNAMPAIVDLNAAFLSYALTGYDGWVSCAGYIGPHVRVDHDVSLLVPEVFSRMTEAERDAHALLAAGDLEPVPDLEFEGRPVLSSRLGHRMTASFATKYFGRVFMHPHAVFTEEMLRPELQDMAVFAQSMDTIVTTHQRVAQAYVDDGTIELACPPLRALLEIMANGTTAAGADLHSPEVRALFTREDVLASAWYAQRLDAKQAADVALAEGGIRALTTFMAVPGNGAVVARLGLEQRLGQGRADAEQLRSPEYRRGLVGTLGLQPGL